MRWPACAVCKKPVERLERDDDAFSGDVIFTAICHGNVERVTLKRSEFRNFRTFQLGDAFRAEVEPKALEG